MKKVLTAFTLLFITTLSFGQNSPEDVVDKIKESCQKSNKELFQSLFSQEGNHAKLASLMTDLYFEATRIKEFLDGLKANYGETYKEDMKGYVGFYMGFFTYSICEDGVNMKVAENDKGEKLVEISSEEWANKTTIEFNLQKVGNEWLIVMRTMKKEDYSDLLLLLEGVKKALIAGEKMLDEEITYDEFINKYNAINSKVMAKIEG